MKRRPALFTQGLPMLEQTFAAMLPNPRIASESKILQFYGLTGSLDVLGKHF